MDQPDPLRITRFDRFRPTKAERQVFDCGDRQLTEWLIRYAGQNMKSRNAVVYLLHEDRQVVGYYTLSAGSVSRESATAAVAHKAPDPVPVILLGRMGVQTDRQGQQLGSRMLQHAVTKAYAATETIAARCLVVHALNARARSFYLRCGLTPSPIAPWTLMLSLTEIEHTSAVMQDRS